jgi:hypothetical protein
VQADIPVGPREAKAVTADMSNHSCERAPCCEKWQGSEVELTVTVADSHYIREAAIICDGMPDQLRAALDKGVFVFVSRADVEETYRNVCAFTGGVGPVAISGDGRSAAAKPFACTRPVQFRLSANEFIKQNKPGPAVVQTTNIEVGKAFTFFVPATGTTTISATTEAGQFALKAGESPEADKRIRFINKIPLQDIGTWFNYVVKAATIPKAVAANRLNWTHNPKPLAKKQ